MYHGGLPGNQNVRTQEYRSPLADTASAKYLPGGCYIDASNARDPDNTSYVHVLRPGLVMGMITATGLYAPSILGLTTVLHDTSVVTTTMTLPARVVTEISRRIGSSGTFKITGPPTAGGTVATETVTFTAIASSTTITLDQATTADFAAGSVIRPTDGSETPLGLIGGISGVRMTDEDGNNVDTQLATLLIGGNLDVDQIINYSSDSSVKAWLKGQLNSASSSLFTFSDAFRI